MEELKINYHYLNQCDMKCAFCFGQMNRGYNKEEILSTFRNLCLVTKTINLAGGEIFLDIDLLQEIVKIGVSNRVGLSLITNGLILTNNLEDSRVQYILQHIKQLGISIDSFNESTNNIIGRASQGETVDKDKLLQLSSLCDHYRTKLKINTVITQLNSDEALGNVITSIKPDTWKVLQVVSDDPAIKVSDKVYDHFVELNRKDINVKIERASKIRQSYVMVNSQGTLYHDGKHFDQVNVNKIVEESRIGSYTNNFKKALDSVGFDTNDYKMRYNNNNEEILFNKRKYTKALGKNFTSKNRVVWFMDVESITARPKQQRKYKVLNGAQIHLLYTILEVNHNMEIINRYTHAIPSGTNVALNLEKDKSEVYKKFFKHFTTQLFKSNPKAILVSGVDTERNFLLDCIYYQSDLTRQQYERIQNHIINLVDIQEIAQKEIIKLPNKKSASRAILDTLNAIRNDLFVYTRKDYKDDTSSSHISNQLLTMYIDKPNDFPILVKQQLENITNYCFTDVYDDYELVFNYELLNNSTVKKELS